MAHVFQALIIHWESHTSVMTCTKSSRTKLGTMTAQRWTQINPKPTHKQSTKIWGRTPYQIQILMTPNMCLLILLDYPGCEKEKLQNLWWRAHKSPRIFPWGPLTAQGSFGKQRCESRRVVVEGKDDQDVLAASGSWWERKRQRWQQSSAPLHPGEGQWAAQSKEPKYRIRYESSGKFHFSNTEVEGHVDAERWGYSALCWEFTSSELETVQTLSSESHLPEWTKIEMDAAKARTYLTDISEGKRYFPFILLNV